jgi:hypothetical protein
MDTKPMALHLMKQFSYLIIKSVKMIKLYNLNKMSRDNNNH